MSIGYFIVMFCFVLFSKRQTNQKYLMAGAKEM